MRILRLGPLLLLLTFLVATPASAVRVAVAVSGTSTGSGMVDIIIQDNDSPHRAPRTPQALYEIDVPIPTDSSAPASAVLLRNGIDEVLPQIYKVEIFNGTTVVIERPGVIADFQVDANVPGQMFEIVPPPGGRAAPVAGICLAIAAAGMGVVAARRLRNRIA